VGTVTLVYPYFHPPSDNSIFRFPPLGLGYVAAYLKHHGVSVDLVDCTFLNQQEALERIRRSKPKIIGIQSMFSMKNKSLELARILREHCQLLVAGGPMPTTRPEDFLRDFDVVVVGEGEQTMLDLVRQVENGDEPDNVKGIACLDKSSGKIRCTPPRSFIADLDSVPFPSRELFDNDAYRSYYSRRFGYTTTSIITSRGCPFTCDFCSRPVFGNEIRTRTETNIADEVETVRSLGYDRVWFADDCFTLNRNRLLRVCNELIKRRLGIGWECLSRVDTVDREVAEKMKKAGCLRVFFGIESGNDSILAIMKKQITVKQADEAVRVFKETGIQVGAFFILGYPGETDRTILDTIRFASSLSLDYLSFTLPYPIPGTPLFERLRNRIVVDEWEEPRSPQLVKHKLLFDSRISEPKLKFAVMKGMTQFYIRKYLGNRGYAVAGASFERITDSIYESLH